MHKLLTILLAFALYAPQTASLLAFSECKVAAILNAKPDCDCKINTLPQQNNTSNLPDKHKEIVQRTDWKYVVENKFTNSIFNTATVANSFQLYHSPHYSLLISKSIFHPPCC